MSIAAARTFIAAVKKTRKDIDDDVNAYYMKFIRGNAVPTKDDVKALKKIITDAEAIAKFYHDDVRDAMQGFGGPSDTAFNGYKTLYRTLSGKVK